MKEKKPLREDIDLNQLDISSMYGSNEPSVRDNPAILDRMEGDHMTTTRTRRHITLQIGNERVTLPSPQFVYDVELMYKRLAKEISVCKNNIKRLQDHNNKLVNEVNRLQKELNNKIDYP